MIIIKKLKNEKAGTLIISAMLLPVFIMLIAFIIDIGGSMMLKEDLYKACLVSAEEASKAIDMEEAQINGMNNLRTDYKTIVDYYFNKNFLPKGNTSLSNLDCTVLNSIEDPMYILVKAESQYETFFLKIIGIEKINVHSQAQGRLRKIK
ncbi:MAG: TadE/TadG family type IV pilus assembly protein [Candidatus Humimicrobiaceae bacterium]